MRLNLNNKTKNLKFWRGRGNKNKFMKPLKEGKSDRPSADIVTPLSPSRFDNSPMVPYHRGKGKMGNVCAAQRSGNLGSGTEKDRLAKIESEDFDNFIERLDLQEWLERLEKELNQIKAKLKG